MTSDKRDKAKNRRLIKRLFQETKQEWPSLTVGSAALIVSSLCNQAVPRILSNLMERNSTKSQTSRHLSSSNSGALSLLRYDRGSINDSSVLPILGWVVLGGGLASMMRTIMLARAENNMASRLRRDAFASLMLNRDVEWFQQSSSISTSDSNEKNDTSSSASTATSPAAIATVLQDDVNTIASTWTTTLANLVRSTSAVVLSTAQMILLDPALLGISGGVVIPLVGASAMLLRQAINKTAKQQRQIQTQTACFVEERLMHVAMVKLAHRERDEVANFEDWQKESLQLARRHAYQSGRMMGFLFAASSGALFVVVNLGANKLSAGQLTSFATYSFLLGIGTSGLVKGVGDLYASLVAAERYYQLLDDNSSNGNEGNTKVSAMSNTVDRPFDAQDIEYIAFENVSFAYRSTGTKVLRDVSFKVNRGQVVALVGKNGSGKSTISSLFTGLLQAASGSIVLSNGTKYSDSTSMGKLVQIIPQSMALFNTSIFENVRYSRPQATRKEVEGALAAANCESLLNRLEGGLDFVVGNNGCKLSGGEQQRIALARALLSDPAFLVMDEPASALDAQGEAAVLDALQESKRKGRGLLLITHHYKTLSQVDYILVMQDGRVAEEGSFADLQADPDSELCKLMPDLRKQADQEASE